MPTRFTADAPVSRMQVNRPAQLTEFGRPVFLNSTLPEEIAQRLDCVVRGHAKLAA